MRAICKTRILLCLSLCLTLFPSAHARLSHNQIDQLSHLSLKNLKSELHDIVSKNYQSLGYDRAKEIIFEKLDNHNGEVCCVYSEDYCLKTSHVPSHKVMNIEHTWPQSLGARGTAKSDLHHLFPTTSSINSTPSNFPFCEVVDVKWEGEGSKMGRDANGTVCFEPPVRHRGDVARAMFYFAVRYGHNIDEAQEKVLRKWHHEDPVDSDELARHNRILDFQHNVNVFVENPELVDDVSDF